MDNLNGESLKSRHGTTHVQINSHFSRVPFNFLALGYEKDQRNFLMYVHDKSTDHPVYKPIFHQLWM